MWLGAFPMESCPLSTQEPEDISVQNAVEFSAPPVFPQVS